MKYRCCGKCGNIEIEYEKASKGFLDAFLLPNIKFGIIMFDMNL
ncbi:hypothetical protein [Oceanirhabdus sp. W0125-5]|nr:hypothetical protein [Oceanirhabdus sp. W0125-5]WBW96693.1 hypothetical protein OW730_23815 [Oceanirhabdus sp. W0125-5]